MGVNPMTAILLGMLTGIGGGMVRDILLARAPIVLHSELYAVSALLGATVVVLDEWLNLHPNLTTLVGGGLCFALRVLSVRRHWRLPISRAYKSDTEKT